MRIIAVSNVKGGGGKTIRAVNLAYPAATSGRSTVLWGVDPQGTATYVLRGVARDQASTRQDACDPHRAVGSAGDGTE